MGSESRTLDRTFSFKVVILGKDNVGKIPLVLAFVEEGERDSKHFSTLQTSFLTKTLNIASKKVRLTIWDAAGQERFAALGPIYYRDSDGAIFVYDVSDKESYVQVKYWVEDLRKMLGKDVSLCIVGNRMDKENGLAVSVAEAESYAESVKAKHFCVEQNKDIDAPFIDLTRRMIEIAEKKNRHCHLKQGIAKRRNVVILDDEDESVKSGRCATG